MYITDSEEKTVKIPVRIVNGNVKYFYGGELPKINDGVVGELIVPEYSILDDRFIEVSQMEDKIQILPSGSIVMATVNYKNTPEDLVNHLIELQGVYRNIRFVKIILNEPLFLQIRGSKKSSLFDVKCYIPSIEEEAISLNNAYFLISSQFEPHRKSHTGNVFKECYYQLNDNWNPLELLRNGEEGKFEGKLFLDYKVFVMNKDNAKIANTLEGPERLLIEAIRYKGRLTGKDIMSCLKRIKVTI